MYSKTERIGRMRHQVYFLTPTPARGDFGEQTSTWALGSAVFADVEYKEAGSSEEERASRKQPFTQIRVTMRYSATVTERMRLKVDGSEFDIISVLPDAKRQYMVIEAEKDGLTKES